jgi:hypothetical protein
MVARSAPTHPSCPSDVSADAETSRPYVAGMTSDEHADPVDLLQTATRRVLDLAQTWLAWDGRPRLAEDGGRIYTPHKAVRRYADHLIDHLAQVEAILAGVPTQPNEWFQSAVTTPADLAPFTEVDLVEATQRISRLSRTLELRLRAAGEAEWDRPRGDEWTLRQIVVHVASPWYAEQVGDLRIG